MQKRKDGLREVANWILPTALTGDMQIAWVNSEGERMSRQASVDHNGQIH